MRAGPYLCDELLPFHDLHLGLPRFQKCGPLAQLLPQISPVPPRLPPLLRRAIHEKREARAQACNNGDVKVLTRFMADRY